MKTFNKTLLAASLFAIAGSAMAVPITGSIAFGNAIGANWTPADNALVTGVATTATADGVVFNANGSGDDGVVSWANGDYAATLGAGVNFHDFVFDPLAAGTALWSFSDAGISYSFTMNLLDPATFAQSASGIKMDGTGYASATGFDNTYGTWGLTLNQNGAAFSFSASSAPEPGIAMLLGFGLLGFAASRKLRG